MMRHSGLAVALAACLLASPVPAATPKAIFGAARVIDGDTLVVAGARVRLEGIDAPELRQRCRRGGSSWNAGEAARERLARLTATGPVTCRTTGHDRYGRALARCRVGGLDLGAELVREGLAWAFVKYSRSFVGEEARAQRDRVGVWQADCERAWDFRREHWHRSARTAPAGCAIKGNVSRHGHIYHMPWDAFYARTRIDPRRGERWFCTEQEARQAGWRPAS